MTNDTFVFEREWESFGAIDAAYDRLFALPEVRQLSEANQSLKADHRVAFFTACSLRKGRPRTTSPMPD
jgi:hypothetical protein